MKLFNRAEPVAVDPDCELHCLSKKDLDELLASLKIEITALRELQDLKFRSGAPDAAIIFFDSQIKALKDKCFEVEQFIVENRRNNFHPVMKLKSRSPRPANHAYLGGLHGMH